MKPNQYLYISIVSFLLIIVAIFLQQVGYQGVFYAPCPLCILQRVGFLGIAIMCFMAASFAYFARWFQALALLSSIFGLGVASRHVWILYHPEVSCGIDPLETWINQFQIVNGLPWLFKADGFCTAQLPLIFGLAVPVWSLIWFVILTSVLLITLFKNK